MPTRDRDQQLARCIESIKAAAGPDDELIIVDSASRDADAIAAIAREADARLLRCERPGVNRARNAGWRAAVHNLVAYVDDDVIVDAAWADGFARSAAAHPEAAFLTGRVSAPDDAVGRHGNVAIKDDAEPAILHRATRGDLGHGANVLVRAAALDDVGGWDEAMGTGARFGSSPEADLYDRLFLAGLVGRYEPAARAWHEQWRTPTQLVRLDWRYGFGNGARIAKLVRRDRPRARQIAGEALWSWGLQRLVAPLRDRNKTEVARVVARLAGTATGFARALFTRVRDGHYVERDAGRGP